MCNHKIIDNISIQSKVELKYTIKEVAVNGNINIDNIKMLITEVIFDYNLIIYIFFLAFIEKNIFYFKKFNKIRLE